MQRSRVDNVIDVFVRQLIAVDSVPAHLFENNAAVGCGFSYMVTGALVTAFHHICQYQNQTVLHPADRIRLFLNICDIFDSFFNGQTEGLVQILNFITGPNIQVSEMLNTAASAFLGFTGKVICGNRHGIDRKDQIIVRKPEADINNHKQEANEQYYDLDQKLHFIQGNLRHGNINACIGLCDSIGIPNRFIHCQQPAKRIIRHQRLNRFPGQ